MGLARARPGRLPVPIPRTRNRHHSTKRPSSKFVRYTATAGAFSTSGLLCWFTTTNESPHLGNPLPEHSMLSELSKSQVTEIISKDAYSVAVNSTPGITRYDGAQLASNSPCEDRFIHGWIPSPAHGKNSWKACRDSWRAWAVLDGHAGWQTAELLTTHLVPFVQRSLDEIRSHPSDSTDSPDSVSRAITKGFLDLDDAITSTALTASQSKIPLQEKAKKLAPAYAGSCALLSLYDPVSRFLHVACTGDSRAVMGRQNSNGTWETLPLSVDQTGSNEEEIDRIYEEHPGEANIVNDGRVLGLMVSRAFGDGRWKWSLDLQEELKRRFNGPSPLPPRYEVQTPPYITAEPVVTSTKIDPSQPSFLILATDGLWDTLSSQQAVNLVGKWLKSREMKKTTDGYLEPTYDPFDFGDFHSGVNWKFEENRTTVQDKNAAVHLVRNSLGGNHHEMVAGRLAFGPPFSRRIRDDITVQVIFFNMPGIEK